MAQEINVTSQLSCTNGNLKIPRLGGSQRITQGTAKGGVPGMISAATAGTGTQITTTGLATPGWTYVKNLDPTNFVEIGPVNGGTFYGAFKLKPGEEQNFRFSNTNPIHIKANTAACDCLVVVLSD